MPLLPGLPGRAAGLDLRRAARADAAGATGWAPSITGCRATSTSFSPSAAAEATWRSSAASRRRSGPTGRSRSPRAPGCTLRIAAKVDNADRDYWQAEIEPLVRGNPLVEFVGEIGERRQGGVPRRRHGAALPDRLAGAVRPGDDRGDGLRHAGDRLPLRLGAGGDRATASPGSWSTASRRRWRRSNAATELDRARGPGDLRAAVQRRADGGRLPARSIEALCGRRPAVARSGGLAADRLTERLRPRPRLRSRMIAPANARARWRSSSCRSPPRCRSGGRGR